MSGEILDADELIGQNNSLHILDCKTESRLHGVSGGEIGDIRVAATFSEAYSDRSHLPRLPDMCC